MIAFHIWKYKYLTFILIVLMCSNSVSYSQFNETEYSQLHAPLDKPMILSGSFCEPRPEHFHTGIDIKTGGREGKNLYAVEDAFIYRIKVKPGGYGKAVYLLHGDSLMSVYAHLNSYNSKIERITRKMQYQDKSFFIDTVLIKDSIKFNKGDIIGYSGNSGSSGGPHLHFELRKMPSQNPVDPQKYFKIKDNISPDFRKIAFYDLNNSCLKEEKRSFVKTNREINSAIVNLPEGKWGIGAEIIDRMNDTWNRYGIKNLSLEVNNKIIYKSELDEFRWKYQNYAEVWFDSYYLETASDYFQRLFFEYDPGFDKIVEYLHKGVIKIKSGEKKDVIIKAEDSNCNKSAIRFSLKGVNKKAKPNNNPDIFKATKNYVIPGNGYFLKIPEFSVFRDYCLNIEKSEGEITKWTFSDHYLSFAKPFSLSLFPDNYFRKHANKTLIVRERNDEKVYLKGKWEGIYYTVESDEPGEFYFDIDTTSPVLTMSNIRDSLNFKSDKIIKYKIKDKKSGIHDYNAFVDNEWVLLEYDAKNDLFKYNIEYSDAKPGWHNFRIVVKDNCGNVFSDNKTVYY